MNERTFRATDADRLDDPDRLSWLPPGEVIAHLGRLEGLHIADIGAGTGFFSLPFAREAGAKGKVSAVDFQEEMLARMRGKLAAPDAPRNVALVHGEAAATGLEARSCDLVFMANVWHELDDTEAVLQEAGRVLRQKGRLAIVDWRSDVVPPPGPPASHRVPQGDLNVSLKRRGWAAPAPVHIGRYHYIQVASLL